MQEFTSYFNEKEITFTENGIRYNNEIFIKYRDMRDISHRTEGHNAIVFRYKDRLARLPYNPEDKPEIMPYLAIAMQQSKEAERANAALKQREETVTFQDTTNDMNKYSYLDMTPQPAQAAEKPKKKTGLVVGLILAIVVVVAVAGLLFLR